LTGIGKSYILARIAVAAHQAGSSPLLVSMEMPSSQFARRILALRTGVSDTHIRLGHLSTLRGRRTVETDVLALEGEPPFYMLDGRFILTVEDLRMHIMTLRPDVVYVDGAYLLKTKGRFSGKWDVVAEAAEQLKITASGENIPLVGTYQLNKDNEVYGSRAIKHLASIVLHLHEPSGDRTLSRWSPERTRIVSIVKGRSGERGRFRVSYNMLNTAIEEMEVLSGTVTGDEGEE
jgi:replicative DNA helicase